MKELEYIRREIRSSGYLSSLQIILRLAQRVPGINKDELNSILSTISCEDIHKIVYTNSYVSALKLKDLYYYNPRPEPKPKPKAKAKRRKKVSAKKKPNILQNTQSK